MTRAKAKTHDAGGATLFAEPPDTKATQAPPIAKPKPASKAVALPSKAAPIQAAKPAEPRNMLAIIAEAAANPAVDVAKMKELLAMQRAIEEREEIRAFNTALLAAQEEIPKIVKDRENDHTKSRYATLEKVSTSIDKIARRHGFAQSFGTADSPLAGHYRIVCDLSHSAGHVRRYHCDLQGDAAGSQGKSNKTPIQGVGSTMSYGRRYLKVMMFDLIIVGEDRDGNRAHVTTTQGGDVIDMEPGGDTITQQQADRLVEAIAGCGLGGAGSNSEANGRKKFCEHYKIAKIIDLPADRFREAMQACADYKAKQQGAHG